MAGRRFWLKAAGAAALTAALGMVAAVVVLKTYFPEPKVRAWVLDSARRRLGREVRLDGLGVGLRGLTLRGLEVSESPDFKAGTFLRVENFRLRPSWRALLRRRLVVASVEADGLSVRVVRGADGRFNYETLGSSAPAASPAPVAAAAGPAPELDVRSARVTDGRIVYQDRASGAAWTVSDADARVDGLRWSAPFDAQVSFRAVGKAGGRPVDAKISADARVDLARGDRAKFQAVVRRLTVAMSGLTLAASGRADGLDAPKVSFDARLSAPGKTLLTAAGTASAGAAGADFEATVKTPGLDTTLLSALVPGAKIPALRLPAGSLTAAGRWAPGGVDLRSAHVAWAGGTVDASGTARGLGTARPAYAGKATFAADTPAIAAGQYPGLGLPPKLAVPAGRLEGAASYKDDVLTLTALKATVPQGTVAASGTVRRLGSAKPDADLTADLALSLPAFKAGDLPSRPAALPPGFLVPATRVDGRLGVKGEEVWLKGLVLKSKEGSLQLDGTVAKAFSGAPDPALDARLQASLPALTDKDLPFPGVPAGLELPPARVDADLSYAPRLVRVRSLRVRAGGNDLEASGAVTDPAGRAAYDLLLKCRRFDLAELTRVTPATRALKLSGDGFFALSVTGAGAKPAFAGKLQFRGLGADAEGLPLSGFTGTVSFDGQRVDAPKVKGKIADGNLALDLTLKDYATRAPEVQMTAALDRFDLGRYLDAKNRLTAARAPAAAPAAPAAGAKAEAPLRVRTMGRVTIGTLVHPNAQVKDVKVTWDLHGAGPDLRGLNGDAQLHVGGGTLHAVGDMATQSKLVKVLIFPLLIVQKLGRVGGIRLFPDFNDITLEGLEGDYLFKDGVMFLRRSEMDSSAARVSAKGSIDLPAEVLDLALTAQVASVAPIDVAVTGTFDKPKTRVNFAKFLTTPAARLIEGLIKR